MGSGGGLVELEDVKSSVLVGESDASWMDCSMLDGSVEISTAESRLRLEQSEEYD